MKSNNQWKVQQLLRLAELCDSEEVERRQKYMNEADRILFSSDEDEESPILEESRLAERVRNGLKGFESEVEGRVCAMEIWCELLGFPREKFTTAKAREINGIMRNMPGWKVYPKSKGRTRHRDYGIVTVYERISAVADE